MKFWTATLLALGLADALDKERLLRNAIRVDPRDLQNGNGYYNHNGGYYSAQNVYGQVCLC